MKRSWRSLLNEWRKESRSKGTLPKQHFPLLLKHLFNDIKPENLISGFWGTGILPLNKDEILKRIGTFPDQLNESADQLLGGSIVRVLQENLGIGKEEKSKSRKRGEKITPGQVIWSLQHDKGKENDEPQPVPSGYHQKSSSIIYKDLESEESEYEEKEDNNCRKLTARKVMRKKESKGNKFRKSLNTWEYRECEEEWNDNDPHVWVECDACGKKYHLQCSDIQYKTKDYWKINLDNFQFEYSECKELYEGC